MKNWINHKFNPLHVFCRMLNIHIPRRLAKFLTRNYERFVWVKYKHLQVQLWEKENDKPKRQ